AELAGVVDGELAGVVDGKGTAAAAVAGGDGEGQVVIAVGVAGADRADGGAVGRGVGNAEALPGRHARRGRLRYVDCNRGGGKGPTGVGGRHRERVAGRGVGTELRAIGYRDIAAVIDGEDAAAVASCDGESQIVVAVVVACNHR